MSTSRVSYQALFDNIRYHQPEWSEDEVADCAQGWMMDQDYHHHKDRNGQRRFFHRLTLVPDVQRTMTQAAMRRSDKMRLDSRGWGLSPPAD